MSYFSLLQQRCNVLHLAEVVVDGLVAHEWAIIDGGANVRCFIDLSFIRRGKDPVMWTPEAGRAQDRSGVLFVAAGTPIKTGHRVEILKGPAGVFSVEGAIDEIWVPQRFHHLECGVQEIGRPIAKGAPTA